MARISGDLLLDVQDLKVYFYTDQGVAPAVDGISFQVHTGATLGIVGESGCGKTVSALSVMRLVPTPPGRIVGGRVLFKGRDLLAVDDEAIRAVRGKEISMVFQEPMTSLNPVFTVGNQITEAILQHEKVTKRAAVDQAIEMLALVGVADPASRMKDYPNQLSGGMRQRVMIAMALCLKPSLLIADEPTTALDVTIQAQILDLIATLRDTLRMAMMLITHDLGVIAEMADGVCVMYAGKVAEYADVGTLFSKPLHPYTQGLLASLPDITRPGGRTARLTTIPGIVPELTRLPPGCRFATRCPLASPECDAAVPPLRQIDPGHWVSCIKV